MITVDEAVRQWREDPQMAALVRDAYLDRDVHAAAKRFFVSEEFAEVKHLLRNRWHGGIVVDLGAGAGIASYAFAQSGAHHVYAVEPDPSDEVGRGAITRLSQGLPIEIIDAYAEKIPLPDNSVDVVYTRQVLHHILDLPTAMNECARILKPGGLFIACREHVVDNEIQKQMFLDNHPMHQLAGNENAYSLPTYLYAITHAGLTSTKTLGPLDSVINAFPQVRSNEELLTLKNDLLKTKFHFLGTVIARMPIISTLVWNFARPIPGRMYSFIALKTS